MGIKGGSKEPLSVSSTFYLMLFGGSVVAYICFTIYMMIKFIKATYG